MTPDALKQVVDEIFAVLSGVTSANPILHFAVQAISALVDQFLPVILANLLSKGSGTK